MFQAGVDAGASSSIVHPAYGWLNPFRLGEKLIQLFIHRPVLSFAPRLFPVDMRFAEPMFGPAQLTFWILHALQRIIIALQCLLRYGVTPFMVVVSAG